MTGAPHPDESPTAGARAEAGSDLDAELLGGRAAACVVERLPQCFDDERFSDEELLEMRGPVSPWDVVLLSSIDPSGLSARGVLLYLRRLDEGKALLAAMEARATVAAAGAEASDSRADRHVAMEVAQLRRVGEGTASTGIATARALHVDYPDFLAALSAGEVSEGHCRILVAETAHVSDRATIAALQDRLLPRAKRRTPSQFRRDVRAAVADLDAEREAERVVRARADRYVSCTPLPHGMGHLGIVTDWPTISAMHAVITADGRSLRSARGGSKAVRDGDDDALSDACRADALAARVLGTVEDDGSIRFDPSDIPVSLTLVVDLDTLRGEIDRHGVLDGEPVPAETARELADAAVMWRRAVTDPVTGHLLDYGREQYLPEKLRDFVLARDLCRAPGCTARAARRLQMDHAVPFPDGDTSATNCGGLCVKHHQLKTARLAHLTDTAADGSATWLTSWGQRITIPPRPFLHDPADNVVSAAPPDAPPPDPSPPDPDRPPRPPLSEPPGSSARAQGNDPPPF